MREKKQKYELFIKYHGYVATVISTDNPKAIAVQYKLMCPWEKYVDWRRIEIISKTPLQDRPVPKKPDSEYACDLF